MVRFVKGQIIFRLTNNLSFCLFPRPVEVKWKLRCKITALKGFLYTDGPFRAVSRTVQILTIWADKSRAKILPFYDVFFQTNFSPSLSYSSIFYTFKKTSRHQYTTKQYFRKMKNNFKELHIVYTFIVLGYGHTPLSA